MDDTHTPQQAGNAGSRKPHFLKRKKVVLAGVVVALAIGLMAYIGIGQFATYYLTVSEFVAEADTQYDRHVRVQGQVASLVPDPENATYSFDLVEGEDSLRVVYHGVIVPDTFKEGSDIVVEGKLDSDDIFQANTLLAKCPSKYEPEDVLEE